MTRRKNRNKKGLGSLLQNQKIKALILFIIMGVGLWAALGGFGLQSAYSERTLETYCGIMLQPATEGVQIEYEFSEMENMEFPKTIKSVYTMDFIRIYGLGIDRDYFVVDVKIESLSRVDYSTVAVLYEISNAPKTGVSYLSAPYDSFAVSYTVLAYQLFDFGDYTETLFRIVVTMDNTRDSLGAEVYELIVSTVGVPPVVGPAVTESIEISSYPDGTEIDYLSNVAIGWTWTGILYDIEIKTDGVLIWTYIEASDNYYLPATEFILDGVPGQSYVIEFSGLTVNGDTTTRIFYTATWIIRDLSAPLDTTVPVFLTEAIGITYIEGALSNVLEWTAEEENKASYIYIIDGVETHYPWTTQGTFSEPFSINVDGLSVGVHVVGVKITDATGNFAESFVEVTVTNIAPILTSPEDVSFKLSDIIPTIVWDVSEYVTAEVDTGIGFIYPLYIGGQISVVCDNLVVGEYDFTITVEDVDGGIATDVVHVIVNAEITPGDVTTPLLTSPSSINGVGSASGVIAWDVTDESSGTYEIKRNGVVVVTGTWLSGDVIKYSYSEIEVGEYYYKLIVEDLAGNIASDIVVIYIHENTVEDPAPIPDYDIEGFIEEYWMYIAIGIGVLVIIPVLTGRRERY